MNQIDTILTLIAQKHLGIETLHHLPAPRRPLIVRARGSITVQVIRQIGRSLARRSTPPDFAREAEPVPEEPEETRPRTPRGHAGGSAQGGGFSAFAR